MPLIPHLKCPEHPEEYLEFQYVGVFTPEDNSGMAYPFYNYCPTSNKIFNGKKIITIEQAALEMINKSLNKKYKLKDIKVTSDLSKLVQKMN